MLISGSQLSSLTHDVKTWTFSDGHSLIRETVSFNAVYYIILCSSSKTLNSWTCKVNSFRKGQIKSIVQGYIWKLRRKQSELFVGSESWRKCIFWHSLLSLLCLKCQKASEHSKCLVCVKCTREVCDEQLINLTHCSTLTLYPATLTEWGPLALTGEPQQMSVCNVSQPAFENVPDEPSLTRTSSRWAARWSFCSLGSCRPRNTSTCIVPSSAWF